MKVLQAMLGLAALPFFLWRISTPSSSYNVLECPLIPPRGYPQEYPILAVLQQWPVTVLTPPLPVEHQGVCVFDLGRTAASLVARQVENYRRAEVPFVVRNDPAVLAAVAKWSDPSYLSAQLAQKLYPVTLSNTTKMTYYAMNPHYNIVPADFTPPTRDAKMSFDEWYQRVTSADTHSDHAYLRLDACWPGRPCDAVGSVTAPFVYDDLEFFRPAMSRYYDVNASTTRGIQCRFGSPGLTAELHFDNERNYLAMVGGSRRFLLSHARNCRHWHLHPQRHPLERHTRVGDWSRLDQVATHLHSARANQVVLAAGDVLYLPTYWFHHIISLDVNYQCNTRSGYSVEYDQTIYDCGFFYDFPQ